MKLEALDHPKTLDFASRLRVELPTAIGYLELLWAFTGKKAPQGNIGKFSDGSIAMACYFRGDPQAFLQSLLQSGFIDAHPVHRYVIHDWQEHAPRWVSAKLKKLNAQFVGNGEPTRTTEPTAVATAEATTEPSPCARASPRQDKGREGKGVYERAQEPTAERLQVPIGRSPDQHSAATWSDQQLADAFAVVRDAYPKRSGDQSVWLLAERAWRDRLDEGVPLHEMLAGVERFALFVAGGGVSGPAFVLSPEKFFDPHARRWTQAWDPPPTKADARLAGNLSAADEFMRRTEVG